MAKKKKLPAWATTVTPFSRILALLMLIIFPILGFYYGLSYQKQLDQNQQVNKMLSYKTITASSHTCLPPDGTITCRTTSDCPNGYTCQTGGPVVYHTNRSCYKIGHAVPM